jgi:undecaprenyl-diphosphatase
LKGFIFNGPEMEFLNQIDTAVFYFINVTLHNAFFDWLMPIVTAKETWFPLWIIATVLLLWKGGRKGRLAVLLVIPLIVMTDQISSTLIKSWVARIRPCNVLPDVHLLGKKLSSYSFPSSHAANFFGLATYFSYLYSRYKWWFFSAAFLVGLSRISVGVHYPLDVVGGGVLGALCAFIIICVYRRVNDWYDRRKN